MVMAIDPVFISLGRRLVAVGSLRESVSPIVENVVMTKSKMENVGGAFS
jgi:hypothetical protein